MTDETEEWPWIDVGPTYSAPGRRRGLVAVPYGVGLPPVGAGYAGTVIGFILTLAACAIGVLFWWQSVLIEGDPAGWWWTALVLPAGFVAVVFCASVYADGVERTMSTRVGWRIVLAAAAAAVVILGAVGLLRADRSVPVFVGRGEAGTAERFVVVIVIALVLFAVFTVSAIRLARRARAEVLRIQRLRAGGRRVPGMVLDVPEPKRWPERGDVRIRIDDPAGERVVTMRLNSDISRIPIRGTRVIAFLDVGDGIHAQLDPEHPPVFIADTSAYDHSSPGGGGM